MTPDDLLALFTHAADAAREAVAGIAAADRRRSTERAGQYHLDLVADAAVLEVLGPAGTAVVSEESGRTGPAGAAVTVVVDPVDGSTNCARELPYWAISLCALDAGGALCALVRNQATGITTTAVRGRGAWRDGERLRAASVTRIEDAVVAFSGMPPRVLPWWQFRSLGSAALALCDVAAGGLDGFLGAEAPWDYLGGMLACREAGAAVVDGEGRSLDVHESDALRYVVAAGTPALLGQLRAAVAA